MNSTWQNASHSRGKPIQNFGYTTTLATAKQYSAAESINHGFKRDFTTYEDEEPEGTSDQLADRRHSGRIRKVTSPIVVHQVVPPQLKAGVVDRKTADEDSISDVIRPPATPSASQHPFLSLGHERYGLPPQLVHNFREVGVNAIYPWQASCLCAKGLLDGRQNLVYTAPTGGGKSLVADICLIKSVTESAGKKGLLVLPYVALVQEKTKSLRRLTENVTKKDASFPTSFTQVRNRQGIIINAFYGGSKSKVTWLDSDIAVCTFEKANLIVNAAIEEGTIDQLGIVVCDELHMLDDEHRGYLLELMLTKVLASQIQVQIIGMSATLSNPELIAEWLRAKFYVAKYRPIPIEEHIVYDNAIYPVANSKEFLKTANQLSSDQPTQKPNEPLCRILQSESKELSNPVTNAVVALAVETTLQGYGSLVFCSSRQMTQNLALLIAGSLPQFHADDERSVARTEALASLQVLPDGFESALLKTIPCGVAFHHAGLTIEERDLVAEGYDKGTLKVLVATCSLAAGINLPARRVILHGARMGRDIVGPAMLRQMRGRAGRKGKDEVGETYLCCQKTELEAVAELLEAELPKVQSCLTPEKRGLKRAVLEVLAIQLASTYDSLQEYAKCSLVWHTSDHERILRMLDEALTSLLRDELITVTTYSTYAPTPLGCAVVASGLSPDDGLFVHKDLRRALSSFVMDSEMHLLYLFTPIPPHNPLIPTTSDISWTIFYHQMSSLDDASLHALTLIGINPAKIVDLSNSGLDNLPDSTPQELHQARVYRRVYSTFALRDICNEVPISTIALRYNLPRGVIQNLAQTCHGFAAGMIKFCRRMAAPTPISAQLLPASTPLQPQRPDIAPGPQAAGFSMLAAILEHTQLRLYASARADLLELSQVTFVKGRMARLLYENGFRSVRVLAEADPKRDILPLIMAVSGHKLRKEKRKSEGEARAGGDEGEVQRSFEVRKRILEDKLLGKAEVMVRSAVGLWEREVLKGGYEEEI